MIAITNTAAGRLEWLEWPLPEPGSGQVRVRVMACGICSTELHMIAGWQRTGFPSIPGHEWSGVVDVLGPGVEPGWLGAHCVAENVLSDGGEVGFEHPGGYAQYLLTEARNLQRLPDEFPFASAALIEPLAVAVRAVRRLGFVIEDAAAPHENLPAASAPAGAPVLLFGDGPVGLLVLLLLRNIGAGPVCLVGGVPERLALARDLGAAQCIDFHDLPPGVQPDLPARFGCAFSYAVEASGSPDAGMTALQSVERGGRVLILGDYGQARMDVPWNFLLHRELEVIGSNASAGAWSAAVRLATTAGLPLERLISHRLPAADFDTAIDLVRTKRDGALKVVLDWG